MEEWAVWGCFARGAELEQCHSTRHGSWFALHYLCWTTYRIRRYECTQVRSALLIVKSRLLCRRYFMRKPDPVIDSYTLADRSSTLERTGYVFKRLCTTLSLSVHGLLYNSTCYYIGGVHGLSLSHSRVLHQCVQGRWWIRSCDVGGLARRREGEHRGMVLHSNRNQPLKATYKFSQYFDYRTSHATDSNGRTHNDTSAAEFCFRLKLEVFNVYWFWRHI